MDEKTELQVVLRFLHDAFFYYLLSKGSAQEHLQVIRVNYVYVFLFIKKSPSKSNVLILMGSIRCQNINSVLFKILHLLILVNLTNNFIIS